MELEFPGEDFHDLVGSKLAQEYIFFIIKDRNQIPEIELADGNSITHFNPLWKADDLMDFELHLTQVEVINFQSSSPKFVTRNVRLSDMGRLDSKTIEIPVTEHIKNNGSLFAHVFLFNQRYPKDLQHSESFLYFRAQLNRYLPKRSTRVKKNLLDPNAPFVEEKEVSNEPKPILSYWWPNITVNLVAETNPISVSVNPLLRPHLRLMDGNYLPVFWNNDFWLLQENLIELNRSIKLVYYNIRDLNLTVSFYQIPMWKFLYYQQFTQSFKIQSEMMGIPQEEIDSIKRMLFETNPILLGVTFAVSLLHSIFDFLAFKNDIQFWRNKKDMEGLSFRTILLNILFQFIVFLYLLDNETSWLIIVSTGAGLAIEIWKVQRAAEFKWKRQFPFVTFSDRQTPSSKVSKTREYDAIAFKYLSYAIYPLLFGYAIYSMLYEQHKSWYSFIVGTLVGFVYAFGFIAMTPQLYINYRLKSVAHMPWKTFMYKALNTFIGWVDVILDDLFAFVIKMPTLHRIACLRDDVIFIIYLYQRWIYVEDKTRPNEFGQVAEPQDELKEKKHQ